MNGFNLIVNVPSWRGVLAALAVIVTMATISAVVQVVLARRRDAHEKGADEWVRQDRRIQAVRWTFIFIGCLCANLVAHLLVVEQPPAAERFGDPSDVTQSLTLSPEQLERVLADLDQLPVVAIER